MAEANGTVRIAAVSDVHYGKASQGALVPLFTEISRQAEVLVISGDLTDYGLPEENTRSTKSSPWKAFASQCAKVRSVRYPACVSASSARSRSSWRTKRSRSFVSRAIPV